MTLEKKYILKLTAAGIPYNVYFNVLCLMYFEAINFCRSGVKLLKFAPGHLLQINLIKLVLMPVHMLVHLSIEKLF